MPRLELPKVVLELVGVVRTHFDRAIISTGSPKSGGRIFYKGGFFIKGDLRKTAEPPQNHSKPPPNHLKICSKMIAFDPQEMVSVALQES